ncbi:unnamed protein product [Penicillium salamii]|uniref:F-box domain-containing protein n=1 Tax=Penicillium salamii TaxID=1612424 RepID=A0A9W4JDH9_9EURO|nr:unnamed protein product [Penicillium salamii]CAG8148951.1 unnamed protein product [Penicillium salamii]CAG8377824.1 unnamed protein product [Penicillium salamii]CAG8379275.1 unnamed protein product [Penicillium salamii]CAG8382890.1 unnamed protein product [Penicillium salamii]
MANTEVSRTRPCSSFLPVFPPELWNIIIEYLDDGATAQNLGRLAQACPALQAIIEPRLYNPVRLHNPESGARLARTIKSRPELAPLIRELRHKEDSGFGGNFYSYCTFYLMVSNLPNLEQIFMRKAIDSIETSQSADDESLEEIYNVLHPALWWSSTPKHVAMPLKEYRKYTNSPVKDRILGSSASHLSPGVEFCESNQFIEYLLMETGIDWRELPRGLPSKGLSSLRVCHIGTHCDLTEISIRGRIPRISSAIFQHSGLRKLCLTGCELKPSTEAMAENSTVLEELTVLNCLTTPVHLKDVLRVPKALKKFTIRTVIDPEESEWSYTDAAGFQYESLEFLDHDIYWGDEEEADFSGLENLKHLTTTLSSLAGKECHELDIEDEQNLPQSLESLTLRLDEHKAWTNSVIYELVKSEKLPNLRRFTVEVPETMESFPSINGDKTNPSCLEICQEGNTWQDKFKEINVDLSMSPVPCPLEVPKYNLCSCECLEFYHRLPSHPHNDFRHPLEDEDSDWNPWVDDTEHDMDDQGIDDTIDQFENDMDDEIFD